MERSQNGKRGTFFRSRGFFIALALCLTAAGIAGYGLLTRPDAPQQDVPDTPVTEPQQEPATPVLEPQPVEDEPLPVREPEPTAEPQPVSTPHELLPQVMSPLDGTTVTVFSMADLMYDETMEDWRTHSGLDIQALEGDAVKTAAGGTVVSVSADELMGTTVVIQHAGGYTTQYSSLQEDPPVRAGQVVAAGDMIGRVGNTATAEISVGPHLHFSVSKDGAVIDPADYVK